MNYHAIMDIKKFKSGGIGKCIQLDEEWITPNEFEKRSGSRGKYLSLFSQISGGTISKNQEI